MRMESWTLSWMPRRRGEVGCTIHTLLSSTCYTLADETSSAQSITVISALSSHVAVTCSSPATATSLSETHVVTPTTTTTTTRATTTTITRTTTHTTTATTTATRTTHQQRLPAARRPHPHPRRPRRAQPPHRKPCQATLSLSHSHVPAACSRRAYALPHLRLHFARCRQRVRAHDTPHRRRRPSTRCDDQRFEGGGTRAQHHQAAHV